MPVVTSDIPQLIAAGLKTDFDAAYRQMMDNPGPGDWQAVATQIDTTLPTQPYGWLGDSPIMEEYVDRVREQVLNQLNYSISDKIFKADLTIERKAIEDDQYGLLRTRVTGLAEVAARHQNKLVFQQLALGATTLCHDGQLFFDTDHAEGDSGIQSNKTTSPLSAATLADAERAMMLLVSDKGEPLEIVPDTLIVGPKLKQLAWELTMSNVVVSPVGSGTASTGATASTNYANYWQGRFKVIVTPHFRGAYDDYWVLADTSKPVKPVILQNRSDVPVSVETDLDNAWAKIQEKYNFTVRGRYGAGYGLWQTAYGGIL